MKDVYVVNIKAIVHARDSMEQKHLKYVEDNIEDVLKDFYSSNHIKLVKFDYKHDKLDFDIIKFEDEK